MSETSVQATRERLLADRQRLLAENAALQLLLAPLARRAPGPPCPVGKPRRRPRCQPRLVAIPEGAAEEDGASDDAGTSSGSTRAPGSLEERASCGSEDERRDVRTTLLLRNFPPELSTRDLVRVLEDAGFLSACTFAYAPADPISARGFGYAVVDLKDHAVAGRVRRHFEGFRSWPGGAREGCSLVWNPARQGLAALQRRYWDVECMAPISRPYVNGHA